MRGYFIPKLLSGQMHTYSHAANRLLYPIIIIIIVAWLKTFAPLRDLWQPQQTIALTGGFRHLRELDPPSYVEVGLDDDSSSDPVSCLLLCRLPVAVQRLQGLLDQAVHIAILGNLNRAKTWAIGGGPRPPSKYAHERYVFQLRSLACH